MIHFH